MTLIKYQLRVNVDRCFFEEKYASLSVHCTQCDDIHASKL